MRRATLVIGGGGFIGEQLVPLLLGCGRCVTVLGRSPAPRHALPEGATYIAGDFATTPLIRPLHAAHQEIIHLAYVTVPNTSYDNPLGDLLENLPPTVQLFTLAAELGLRLVRVSSGGTVYGEAAALPIPEDHPTYPISPYGVTKLTLEKYAHPYAATRGLDVVCLRPANAYGEGQRPFTGQGFIATAMASALRNEPARIFGARGAIRDYIRAHNIASGIGPSNLDVVEAMAPLLQEAGCTVRKAHGSERPFDVRANVLDSSRLTEHTGWKPAVGFEEGLLRTSDWLIGQHHG